jgi:2'-5' RNA ligase
MRVYVALPLPETFKAELSRWFLPLRKENSQFHWVDDTDLHITIAFPGELDARCTHYVQNVVKESVGDFGPVRASVSGLFLCAFRRERRGQFPISSKTLWLFGNGWNGRSKSGGVDCIALKFKDGVEEITALADSIDARLTRVGKKIGYIFHERIKRPFIPYVVVVRRGRPRTPVALDSKGKYFQDMTFNPPMECVLGKVAVYISAKKSSGDVWTAQKVFGL